MQHNGKDTFSKAQMYIVEKPMQAKALRQAMITVESSKAFLQFCSDTQTLQFGQMENLDKLVAVTIDLETKSFRGIPILQALSMMELHTLAILGDAGLGKTALARSMAALQCHVRKLPYWIESNTPDSLRQVSVNGFFRDHVPVILDEWRPTRKGATGSNGSEMLDMLKCLTSAADGATIRCRYSDIRFAPRMPKSLTCNSRSIDEWMAQTADYVADEDYNAIMRRCLFVEVKHSLIPEALRDEYVKHRETELHDLQVEALRAQGIELEAHAGLSPVDRAADGSWRARGR
jgi:hypothetical protein